MKREAAVFAATVAAVAAVWAHAMYQAAAWFLASL